MPELPEVETTVQELIRAKPKILGRVFINFWAENKKLIKRPKSFQKFRKELTNRKILKIWRRGKNILFDLEGERTLLIHQKLTGHLLFGKWKKTKEGWISLIEGPLKDDPVNQYLRAIFFLDNSWQLALSDLRKFAKIELFTQKEELEKELSKLGPEPLEESFIFEKFKEVILKKKQRKIREVLMDQTVIAGIGNIYSSEILWQAKVHPLRPVKSLSEKELKEIFLAMKEILQKAIEAKGESFSDYRRITGEKGEFDRLRKVYKREGEECPRCKTKIKRIKIGQRSAYFCPNCQR